MVIENKIKDIVELTLEEQKFFHGLTNQKNQKKLKKLVYIVVVLQY